MDVDEAGGHVASRGVDHPVGGGVRERPERGDAAVADPDVGPEPGIARAVEDPAAADEQVEVLGLLGGEGGGGRSEGTQDEGEGDEAVWESPGQRGVAHGGDGLVRGKGGS